ncbi:unnamed protein product [Darwinula stevensoni]|uniref:Ig-like domain-containing protein n=1 Tax=Darwinula stevensoni TaxID=69355 RepID=A0A7R9A913_9CRUS|nr:unnamed protein product [Darwinula stevensoni]CAG0896990.1 unnamed protein product [Darwinula stevensoni]
MEENERRRILIIITTDILIIFLITMPLDWLELPSNVTWSYVAWAENDDDIPERTSERSRKRVRGDSARTFHVVTERIEKHGIPRSRIARSNSVEVTGDRSSRSRRLDFLLSMMLSVLGRVGGTVGVDRKRDRLRLSLHPVFPTVFSHPVNSGSRRRDRVPETAIRLSKESSERSGVVLPRDTCSPSRCGCLPSPFLTHLFLLSLPRGPDGCCDSARHERGVEGTGVLLPCRLALPALPALPLRERPVPFIVKWLKKDGSSGENRPVFIHYEKYPPHVDEGYRGRMGLAQTETAADLNVSSLKPSDAGWYGCQVILLDRSPNGHHPIRWIHLDVLPLPETLRFAVRPPEEVLVHEGENLVLNCEAVGDPEPSVAWSKGAEPVPVEGRYALGRDGKELVVTGVEEGDLGEFVCRAENSRATIQTRVTVSTFRASVFSLLRRRAGTAIGRVETKPNRRIPGKIPYSLPPPRRTVKMKPPVSHRYELDGASYE